VSCPDVSRDTDGVGKVRARHLMSELEISESRRLRGLGTNQRRALLEKFVG